MLATKRTVSRAERRATLAHPRRRVYVGSAVRRHVSSRFFLTRTTQQVTSRRLLGDCVGVVVTLGGIAGWAMLIMLLGA